MGGCGGSGAEASGPPLTGGHGGSGVCLKLRDYPSGLPDEFYTLIFTGGQGAPRRGLVITMQLRGPQ